MLGFCSVDKLLVYKVGLCAPSWAPLPYNQGRVCDVVLEGLLNYFVLPLTAQHEACL